MIAYQDRNHHGNSAKYLSGHPCIENCGRQAGTWWSKYWCFECNVVRMDRISKNLDDIAASYGIKK